MNFAAVPEPGSKPSDPGAPEPPKSDSRRLGAFPWLVLGAAVGAMGLLFLLLSVLGAEPKGRTASSPVERAREASGSETLHEAVRNESSEPLAKRKPADAVEPADVVPVAATSDAQGTAPPADWPPARAFTARCRAAGGGCVEQCTMLAGGRCLDPCFIHTAECSNDCKKPDGTCGWPPPDSE